MKSIQKTAVNLTFSYVSTILLRNCQDVQNCRDVGQGKMHAHMIRPLRNMLLDENSVWHTFVEAVR